jgi:hypothetical protein
LGSVEIYHCGCALRTSEWRRELDMNSLVKESDAALVQSVNLELTVLMPCLNVAETPLSRAPTRPSGDIFRGILAR